MFCRDDATPPMRMEEPPLEEMKPEEKEEEEEEEKPSTSEADLDPPPYTNGETGEQEAVQEDVS